MTLYGRRSSSYCLLAASTVFLNLSRAAFCLAAESLYACRIACLPSLNAVPAASTPAWAAGNQVPPDWDLCGDRGRDRLGLGDRDRDLGLGDLGLGDVFPAMIHAIGFYNSRADNILGQLNSAPSNNGFRSRIRASRARDPITSRQKRAHQPEPTSLGAKRASAMVSSRQLCTRS